MLAEKRPGVLIKGRWQHFITGAAISSGREIKTVMTGNNSSLEDLCTDGGDAVIGAHRLAARSSVRVARHQSFPEGLAGIGNMPYMTTVVI